MASLAQRVDAVLGPGWYRAWEELERRRAAAEREIENYQRQLAAIRADDAAERFLKDSFTLAKIARDYRQGLNLIARGNRLDPEEVGRIHDLFTLALGVVEVDVELCRTFFGGGLAIGFVLLPLGLLQHRAQALQRWVLRLKAELERAKGELREAQAQFVINTALTGISMLLPGLSLIGKGAIFLGQLASDQLLGPDSAVRHAGAGTAFQAVTTFADATEKIEALRHSSVARAARGRTAGAAAAFLGVQTDLEEVLAGYHRRERIREALRNAEKAYDELMRNLSRYRTRLRGLRTFIRRWQATMAGKVADAARVRKVLEAEMRRVRYPTGFLPYQWRSLSAPGAVRAGVRPPVSAHAGRFRG